MWREQIGGVRWASNNYHHDHPLFAEYLDTRLESSIGSKKREDLVKDWENLMIKDLDPKRKHAANTSFGDGEQFEDLQLEFNAWVSNVYNPIHVLILEPFMV